MKNILVTLILLGIVGAGIGAAGWSWYQRFLAEPVVLDQEQALFTVPAGATLRSVAHELADRRWISSRFLFTMLAYQTQQEGALKAGEYAVPNGVLPAELLGILTSGKSIQFPVTLIPGMTFREAIKRVADIEVFKNELADLTDEEIMQRIGLDAEHPEGWLFPDTYLFDRGTTDAEILTRARERMRAVLDEEWQRRREGLPLETPEEALTLASIVEKETGLASERPRIAGVFVRRLQKGMKLQTDPTVIYGMGDDYDGNIRRDDLTRPTPYNTYVIGGLPPTPIALPGREAINAALNPADGDALYFVARGDGSHHFSATLDEHNCAVRHYQLNKPCAALVEQ
ncbi:MAG: endolytic transglycosylase MltG [Thiohalocapsa sp.]